jgi:hypothetical protein
MALQRLRLAGAKSVMVMTLPDNTQLTKIIKNIILDESGLSNELRAVDLTSVSKAECQLTYGSQIIDSMVCVNGNYNEGTCTVSGF